MKKVGDLDTVLSLVLRFSFIKLSNLLPFVFVCNLMQTYPHKLLTGRRSLKHMHRQTTNVSDCKCHTESIHDPIGAAHGCNSISAGLGRIYLFIPY